MEKNWLSTYYEGQNHYYTGKGTMPQTNYRDEPVSIIKIYREQKTMLLETKNKGRIFLTANDAAQKNFTLE